MVKIRKDPRWIKHRERNVWEKWVDMKGFLAIPMLLCIDNCHHSESHLEIETVFLCGIWWGWKYMLLLLWNISLPRPLSLFLIPQYKTTWTYKSNREDPWYSRSLCCHFYFEKHRSTFWIGLTASSSLLDESIQFSFFFHLSCCLAASKSW